MGSKKKLEVIFSKDVPEEKRSEDFSVQYSFGVGKDGTVRKRRSKVSIVANSFSGFEPKCKVFEGEKVKNLPVEFYELWGYIRGSLGGDVAFDEVILFKDDKEVYFSVVGSRPEYHELILRYNYLDKLSPNDILKSVVCVVDTLCMSYGEVHRVSVKSYRVEDLRNSSAYEGIYVGYGGDCSGKSSRELIIMVG